MTDISDAERIATFVGTYTATLRASLDAALARVGVLEAALREIVACLDGSRTETISDGYRDEVISKYSLRGALATARTALASPPPHDAEPCSCGRVALDWFTSTHSKLTKEGERFISTNHRRDRCDREEVIPDAPHDGEGAPRWVKTMESRVDAPPPRPKYTPPRIKKGLP